MSERPTMAEATVLFYPQIMATTYRYEGEFIDDLPPLPVMVTRSETVRYREPLYLRVQANLPLRDSPAIYGDVIAWETACALKDLGLYLRGKTDEGALFVKALSEHVSAVVRSILPPDAA